MPRFAKAAVMRAAGEPLAIEQILVGDPRPNELLVRMVATGICHTDLHAISGHMKSPLPAVLGHEGAGIVEAVGAQVTTFAPGDHVVLSFAHCGQCHACDEGVPSYCADFWPRNFGFARPDGSGAYIGEDAPRSHFFGQSSFAGYSLVEASNAVKVATDIPLELLGPLGCGVQTGAGAILNALQVRPGKWVAVFGAGAVGLSAIMAARLAGAAHIVALDKIQSRLDLALDVGASHVVNVASEEALPALTALRPGGIHYTLDTTGVASVIDQAIMCLAPLGVCGLVAVGGAQPILPASHLLAGRTIRGIIEGDAVSSTFIPILVDMIRQGRLPLDRLVKYYPIDEINEAIAAARSGDVVKPIVRF